MKENQKLYKKAKKGVLDWIIHRTTYKYTYRIVYYNTKQDGVEWKRMNDTNKKKH